MKIFRFSNFKTKVVSFDRVVVQFIMTLGLYLFTTMNLVLSHSSINTTPVLLNVFENQLSLNVF